MMNVKQLRDAGFKVRVIHRRVYRGLLESSSDKDYIFDNLQTRREFEAQELDFDEDVRFRYADQVLPFGGLTRVEVTTPNGDELVGESKCSLVDNYNKRKGVRIALGRCLNGVKLNY